MKASWFDTRYALLTPNGSPIPPTLSRPPGHTKGPTPFALSRPQGRIDGCSPRTSKHTPFALSRPPGRIEGYVKPQHGPTTGFDTRYALLTPNGGSIPPTLSRPPGHTKGPTPFALSRPPGHIEGCSPRTSKHTPFALSRPPGRIEGCSTTMKHNAGVKGQGSGTY